MTRRPPRLGALGATRARVVEILRRSAMSANEIAAELGLTHNAVRGHLSALVRDGFVREGGQRRGSSRPTTLYELVPGAEAALSRAYVPFVAHLLRVLGETMSEAEMNDTMRTVGRSLAADWPRPRGDLQQRVTAATVLLKVLGAHTTMEPSNGGFTIQGYGCLLSEAVHGRPEVCRAVESLLAELLEAGVDQCCERGERPRCCFRVHPGPSAAPSATRLLT